jgi:hypothetical protein
LVADVAETVDAADVVVELPRATRGVGGRPVLLQRLLALGLRAPLRLSGGQLRAEVRDGGGAPASDEGGQDETCGDERALHAAMMHVLRASVS